MGGCVGAPTKADDQQETNKNINKQLEEERKKLDNEIKMLLLGAGEAGKTTLSKQMRIIQLDGFTEEERMTHKSIIYENILNSMKVLIAQCETFEYELEPKSKEAAQKLLSLDEYFSDNIAGEIGDHLSVLWKDPAIQKCIGRRKEFQLIDSCAYLFENLERIKKLDYTPTEEDILNCRSKTTGITEIEFDLEGMHYRLVDVGGQRSERKKWMHCFQDVTAALFCCALSEYDLLLYEDNKTNRMLESLKLFREICNNKWFVKSSIILFLTKRDIFEEKIKHSDLNICFEDYTGGCNYQNASEFIKKRFLEQNTNTTRQVFVHCVCTTNTSDIRLVWDDLRSSLLQQVIMSSAGDLM